MDSQEVPNQETAAETMTVKVGKTGGKVEELTLQGQVTVGDALKAAGLEYDSKKDQLRVNGKFAKLGTPLKDQSLVLLSQNVVGG